MCSDTSLYYYYYYGKLTEFFYPHTNPTFSVPRGRSRKRHHKVKLRRTNSRNQQFKSNQVLRTLSPRNRAIATIISAWPVVRTAGRPFRDRRAPGTTQSCL